MLLSPVSVLVVAQSSSEVPEGLMNNPVLWPDDDQLREYVIQNKIIFRANEKVLLCKTSSPAQILVYPVFRSRELSH